MAYNNFLYIVILQNNDQVDNFILNSFGYLGTGSRNFGSGCPFPSNLGKTEKLQLSSSTRSRRSKVWIG